MIIGGAEDRVHGVGALERFTALAGGSSARIALITTATEAPEEVLADYKQIFRKLGARKILPLRLEGRGDADDERTLAPLEQASGLFISRRGHTRLPPPLSSPT